MLMGLPAVLTGGALVAYAIGKHFDPQIETKILSMFTGKKKEIANIIKAFGPYIKEAADATGVPWQYIVGIIWKETRGVWNLPINSTWPQKWVRVEQGHKKYYPAGSDYHLYSSYGPMQVSWTTAGKGMGLVNNWTQLLDFRTNILCGAKILASNYSSYRNWNNAVRAYNGPITSSVTKAYLDDVASAVVVLNEMIKANEVYYA